MNGEWVITYPGVVYAFGTPATPTFNRKTPEIGSPEIRTADTDRPRGDGRVFGVDFHSGQTIHFDLGIRASSEEDVRAEAERLAQVWRANPVRFLPGAVAELRTEYAGRERVVYGRPRRWSPDLSDATHNYYVTALADFACVDDLFYGVTEYVETVALVPQQGGGLIAPLASPLSTTRTSDRSRVINVGGELDTWPVIEIHGPITNPLVEVSGALRIEVRATLSPDDVLVIDTRPWQRSVTLNGSGTLAGRLRGTRLSKAVLPPGRYDVSLKGMDATGTSSMNIRWREAFASL